MGDSSLYAYMPISNLAPLLAVLSSACLATGSGTFRAGGSAGPVPAYGSPQPAEGYEEAPSSSYGGPAGPMAGNSAPPAAARPVEPRWDDFAFAVRERTGTYWGPWTFTKLTTFQVSPACYSRLGTKDSYSLNNASYYTRSVGELAKTWTGEDWDRIESQRSDRAKDRVLVEPMIDQFAQRFHMTIAIEGDDCDVGHDAAWIRYWYTTANAFANYPPASGKLAVTLKVSAAARDVTVTVDPSGSVFDVTVPRDIEPRDWSEKIEQPFRRHAARL